MALVFHPPNVVRRHLNPADDLALNGLHGASELGFAEPSFNNVVMIQARGILGNLPPAAMNLPTFAEGQAGQDHTIRVQPFQNTISWRIELPPDPVQGVWTSGQVSSFEVNRLARDLIGHPSAGRYPNVWDWKVVIHPLPDAASFMNHIRWHEYQHCADHRWLAEQIFGPWDNWLERARTQNLRFRASNLHTLRNEVMIPGNYATGTLRILRYWQSAIKQSGDLYHQTLAGRTPVLKFWKLVGTPRIHSGKMELHLTVEAAQRIVAPIDQNSNPHTYFTLRPLGHPIDGNEAPLAPNPVAPPARQIDAHGVHGAGNGQDIVINMQDDDDFGLGGLGL